MEITKTIRNLSIFAVLALVSVLIIACNSKSDTVGPNGPNVQNNAQGATVNSPSQSLDSTGLPHTLYILVMVNQFNVGCPVSNSENDPFPSLGGSVVCYTLDQLSYVWSPSANAIRNILAGAGFRTVFAVAAETKNAQHVFSVIGRVEDIVDGASRVRFADIFSKLFDGTVRWPPASERLNKHPLQIRADFEAALASQLVPNSRLIVLNQPQGQHVSVNCFNEPALVRMCVIDGFLTPGASLEEAFRSVLH